MKKLIIVRGLPGSGKSFLANQLYEKYDYDRCNTVEENVHCLDIFSTDYFWERPNNYYDFNPRLLKEAHQWNYSCFNRFMKAYKLYNAIAILDNTNITWSEIEQYVMKAKDLDYSIEILEPDTSWKYDPEECHKRNTHGVPLETIKRMHSKWRSTESLLEKINRIINITKSL